jgi:AbrB family looped-hinge helix DNA binding protein
MIQSTTITKKWQMTIPKTTRDILGLTKTGEVLIEVVNQKQKTVTIKPKPSIMDLAGFLPVVNAQGEKLDIVNVRDYIEKNYKRS